jgi:hypothetical protein
VGFRAALDGCGKSRPAFDTRTVQPVANRYTDCVIPAYTHTHTHTHTHIYIYIYMVNIQFTLEKASNTQRGSRDIALLFLYPQ